jgi:hypothetical protein
VAFAITLAPVGVTSIIAGLSHLRRRTVSERFRNSGRPANRDLRRCRNAKMPNRRAADERQPRVRYPLVSRATASEGAKRNAKRTSRAARLPARREGFLVGFSGIRGSSPSREITIRGQRPARFVEGGL